MSINTDDLFRAATELLRDLRKLVRVTTDVLEEVELPLPNDIVNGDSDCKCGGKGWDFYEGNDGRIVLQCCDDCQKFLSDQDAGEAMLPVLEEFAQKKIQKEAK